MADEHDDRLEKLREQLYQRPAVDPDRGRTAFPEHKTQTSTPPVWRDVRDAAIERPQPPVVLQRFATDATLFSQPMKKRKKFRIVMLVGGAIFFIIAAVLASTYIFFGKNAISGNNITLEARGPFAIGGGDTYNFTVTMTNQNVVAVDAATLIIEYPQGTQSATEKGKDQSRERRTLEHIKPGEVMNIPISAVIFGEENQEKEIRVTMEYRVGGSNATFYRDATPLHFKITSSPVSLSVEAVDHITSGQEMDFAVTLTSNAPSPLKDLLVKVQYPDYGFDYSDADPKPAAGTDTWTIPELKPGEKKVIKLHGQITGKKDEKRIFNFTAGVANESDALVVASTLSTKSQEVTLEQAFVALGMTVNGKTGDNVTVAPREAALYEITFQNTLPDTIHDAVIEVTLSGNALDKQSVGSGSGFFDSNTNKITWDGTGNDSLRTIAPGQSNIVSFSLTPALGGDVRTPQVVATVNVKGKRTSQTNVPESLTAALVRTVKVASSVSLSAQSVYSTGPFSNTGPVPPVAETPTTYTEYLSIQNGSNALTGTIVEATLPQYVRWVNESSALLGTISYNATTRALTWKIGDVNAAAIVSAAFKVSLLPSVSQVGTIPPLVTDIRLKSNDRFTGSIIRATAPDLTTDLPGDPDNSKHDGRVIAP